MRNIVVCVMLFILISSGPAADPPGAESQELGRSEWPQYQHDARRSGYTPHAPVLPPGERRIINGLFWGPVAERWRYDLGFDPPERFYTTAQVVVGAGRAFIATMEGSLLALDCKTGELLWRFQCGEGVMHTAGVGNGRVFFATIAGSVFGVDAGTGKQLWHWRNGLRTGFSGAVLLADGKVFVAGRAGDVHALSQADGVALWSADAGGPVYSTTAYYDGRLYVVTENMSALAFAADSGKQVWKTDKLPGMTFRDYCPVVHRGHLILTPIPSWNVWYQNEAWFPLSFRTDALDKWLAPFKEGIEQGKPSSEALADIIGAQDRQIELFGKEPKKTLRYALDCETGKMAFPLPFFMQSNSGSQPPPCEDRDGMLVMPVMLNNSNWGRLDLDRRRIVDIFGTEPRGNADEEVVVSAAGPFIFVIGPASAYGPGFYNLDTRKWDFMFFKGGAFFNSGRNPVSTAAGLFFCQAGSAVCCAGPNRPAPEEKKP